MKRVLTAVVLVPLVLLVVFRAPLWLFVFVVGLVVLLSLLEYLDIVERYGIKPFRKAAYLVSILVVVQSYIFFATMYDAASPNYLSNMRISQNFQDVILVLTPLIFGIPLVLRRELGMALAASAASAFAVFYIAVPLSLIVAMRWSPDRSVLLVFALISVWAGDIAAYYVGRALGRHKLAPVVSPGKTWEGAVASVIASVAVSFLVFRFQEQLGRMFSEPKMSFYIPLNSGLHLSVANMIAVGVVTNIAAQFGDLFESAIKRGAQVKDSGSLLPGHGGILDRIDALLFAIPAVWYYAILFLQRATF